ncbi:MAG: hypothetical protein NTV26_06185, partial [Caldiserica bacterium]|nr:hypothetical protein [Caldisericota bacterium]
MRSHPWRHLTLVLTAAISGAAVISLRLPVLVKRAAHQVVEAAPVDAARIAGDAGVVLSSGAVVQVQHVRGSFQFVAPRPYVIHV